MKKLTPIAQAVLKIPVRLNVILYAIDLAGQVEVLRRMAERGLRFVCPFIGKRRDCARQGEEDCRSGVFRAHFQPGHGQAVHHHRVAFHRAIGHAHWRAVSPRIGKPDAVGSKRRAAMNGNCLWLMPTSSERIIFGQQSSCRNPM